MKTLFLLPFIATLLLTTVRAEFPGSDLLADLLLSKIDGNGDEHLDSGEWQGGLEKGFRAMDRDGTDSISAAEIDAIQPPIARELGESAAAACVAVIRGTIKALDKNGDGSTTREEFHETASALVAKMDGDNDAVLDRAEIEALPARLVAAALLDRE